MIQDGLRRLRSGRTSFVIAHRLSTIRNATRILVFENGRVIENGTFDELVARGGHFAQLAKAQFMVQDSSRSDAPADPSLPQTAVASAQT
jgi:ATP-binding cassette subfamily B protein